MDDDELGLDEISKLGPGGNYLTSGLTMRNFRGQRPLSEIWPVLALEKWQKRGQPKAGDWLREYTRELMNRAQAPEDHDNLLASGQRFIDKWSQLNG